MNGLAGDAVIALLRRQEGKSIQRIMEVIERQQHSVRGFLGGDARRCALSRGLSLFISLVTSNDAAGNSPKLAVSRKVSGNSSDDCAFDAAFRFRRAC